MSAGPGARHGLEDSLREGALGVDHGEFPRGRGPGVRLQRGEEEVAGLAVGHAADGQLRERVAVGVGIDGVAPHDEVVRVLKVGLLGVAAQLARERVEPGGGHDIIAAEQHDSL